MNPDDPVHVLCTLLGITPQDLAVPSRILKVDPTENNELRIEDASQACFARVRSIQHRVPQEHGEWMMQVVIHARSAMLRAAKAPSVPRPIKPTPTPAWTPQPATYSQTAAPQAPEPPLIVRTHVPRYRHGFTLENLAGAVGALVMCGLVLLGVGWFINQSWEDLNEKTRPGARPKPGLTEITPVRPIVRPGGGKPAKPKKTPGTSEPEEGGGASVVPASVADAHRQLEDALKLARQGSFDEALRLTQRASAALPDQSEGLGLIIEYARQYTQLAEQARRALNGSNEVDLGYPYGKAQFVEQDMNQITFFAKGKHERFPIAKFNSLKGVRFRVTRDFLDNAENSANDLILGACHFLMKVGDTGEQSAGSDGTREAERRFSKAIASGDSVSVEQGKLMITAMKAMKALTAK